MMRYWPDTTMIILETILMPIAYWAQAAGFEGGDPNASEAFARRSGTTEVAGFIYLGWVVYMWVTTIVWGPGTSLRKERMQGSLEPLFLTQVSRFTLLFAPPTTQLFPTAILFTVVGLMMRYAFGVPLEIGQIFAGVLVVIASIPLLFGLGALVGVSVMRMRDSSGLNSALRGLIGLFCGITFPIAVLPEWVQPISRALPITQIVDALRAAVLSRPELAELWSRSLILLAFGVVISASAMVLLQLTLRNVRRTGRLGHF